jgi:GH25 family lysozyme M1 (1,4-beta-N-acetylmuramidase)
VKHVILASLFVVGCAAESEVVSVAEQDATVCGVGPTVKGIDVSYYQGTINWTAVKGDGVKFAYIRASDGLNTIDTKFEANWSGSRAAGIKHGAYQFFRPSQDAIAQADLLLDKIGGQLAADDLPPVIDVEASDGQSAAVITSKVKAWVAHVKAATGRDPVIYTGFYFWRDSVGAPDVTTSPLWHAQYSTAACPNIAPPCDQWAIWQYSSSGTVAGISGNVDMNRWNGDEASLQAFLGPPNSGGGGGGGGGGGATEPCGTIGAAGGVIDDGDKCFEGGGPEASMRKVSTAGKDGDLVWTHTTEDAEEANYGTWNLNFAEAGRYRVEVFTDAAFAQSKQANYLVQAGAAETDVVIDQTAVSDWQTLGEFDFEAGGEQWIHLADNTGEPLANNVQLVFDAVRITRVVDDTGSGGDHFENDPGDEGGCNAGGGSAGLFVLLALVGLRRRR